MQLRQRSEPFRPRPKGLPARNCPKALATPLAWRMQLARSTTRRTTAAEQVPIDQLRQTQIRNV
ncbi:hypothetical protein CVV68_13850 [Arthrobacter livingstonensis]|uniref:Uncharacterized protein n=1 Tax=Arthrobacter livingstonensis TaxID=670078 RepID=A0A2V5L5D8_9MICC|nr:hypothetical protein [Arthrobacter livingstonensis]PYI66388.1 hypothetical protein CVV68_13850 [Arthrobacter livingstonensis]